MHVFLASSTSVVRLLRPACGVLSAILLAAGAAAAADAPAVDAATLARVVDRYAGSLVRDGEAAGIAVAVVVDGHPARLFTYGSGTVGRGGGRSVPVGADTIYELASLSKVFTTNLLGQRVAEGKVSLRDDLRSYPRLLGRLPPLTGRITLRELGDFTSGLLDGPPRCRGGQKPLTTGCMPGSGYAPLDRYGADAFLTLIRTTTLRNWQSGRPARSLPAQYNYSNTSMTLLGLILGADPDAPMTNAALWGWFDLVRARILAPLAMRSTFLTVPEDARDRQARGYDIALAYPVIADGQLKRVGMVSGGSGYTRLPRVSVLGGGGTGAAAAAGLRGGRVDGITVIAGGSGYVGQPIVWLRGRRDGRSIAVRAKARVIVEAGSVVAVRLDSNGYAFDAAPAVEIVGGRRAGAGRQASVRAWLIGGWATFIEVVDGGDGYVDPLRIVVEPGDGVRDPTNIYGPAGFLRSTITDMAAFTEAALGLERAGGELVPARLAEGFRIAQKAYACQDGQPRIDRGCGPDPRYSGLAWHIVPKGRGSPLVIAKDGALQGFTSMIVLLPERRIAVVALASSGNALAHWAAYNIAYDLYFR